MLLRPKMISPRTNLVHMIRELLAERLEQQQSWTANQVMIQFEYSVLDALDLKDGIEPGA